MLSDVRTGWYRSHAYKAVVILVVIVAGLSLEPLTFHRLRLFHGAGLVHANGTTVHLSHLAGIVLGLGLIYLSFQLWRRRRRALYITAASLLVLTAVTLIHGHHEWRAAAYAVCLGLLITVRRSFSVRSDNLSLRRGVVAALAVMAVTLIYGTAGFYLLEKRDFGIDFNLWQAFRHAVMQLVTFQNGSLRPATPPARLFLESLNVIGLTMLSLTTWSLFAPIRFVLNDTTADRRRAEAILQAYSRSAEDFFKLWPADKHYFFEGDEAFLAYGVHAGTALVLDGPAGQPAAYRRLVERFLTFAANNGWSPAVIHADDDILPVMRDYGFKRIFIGSEAMVDVAAFAATTYRSKHFRYVENRAVKEGLEFEIWPAPQTSTRLRDIRKVSDGWLRRPGRREYGFIMGYFEDDYLRRCDVAILRQHGQVVAYCNLIPGYVSDSRSIDHMRFTAGLPGIGMHYLLKRLILHVHGQGARWFNLGLSPLSGIEERDSRTVPERLLTAVKAFGARYYSFQGLEQFKNKFEPDWRPRYIYYAGADARLLTLATAMNRATSRPSAGWWPRIAVAVTALAAGLTYASFPLASVLGVSSRGLASELGAEGAPWAWLFNGLDFLSGSLIIALAGLIVRNRAVGRNARRYRWLALFYAFSGLGGILAALAALPTHTDLSRGLAVVLYDSAVLSHSLFSAINFGALLLAAGLAAVRRVDTVRQLALASLYTALLLTGLISLLYADSTVAGLMERLYIVCVGIWIFLIGCLAWPRR